LSADLGLPIADWTVARMHALGRQPGPPCFGRARPRELARPGRLLDRFFLLKGHFPEISG